MFFSILSRARPVVNFINYLITLGLGRGALRGYSFNHQPIALEPMPPHERRIIHIALRDHTIVSTQSIGKGDQRKVTIVPKGSGGSTH